MSVCVASTPGSPAKQIILVHTRKAGNTEIFSRQYDISEYSTNVWRYLVQFAYGIYGGTVKMIPYQMLKLHKERWNGTVLFVYLKRTSDDILFLY